MSSITTSSNDGILSIQPTIDPVASVTKELREEILAKLDSEANYTKVLFDLQSVKILDSSGIGIIIATYNTLKKNAIDFSVVNASSDIASLLSSMGLNNHFPIENG